MYISPCNPAQILQTLSSPAVMNSAFTTTPSTPQFLYSCIVAAWWARMISVRAINVARRCAGINRPIVSVNPKSPIFVPLMVPTSLRASNRGLSPSARPCARTRLICVFICSVNPLISENVLVYINPSLSI